MPWDQLPHTVIAIVWFGFPVTLPEDPRWLKTMNNYCVAISGGWDLGAAESVTAWAL